MLGLTTSPPEQAAEFLRPFRQALQPNPHQGGPVRGHDRHPQLERSAMRPFVAHLSNTASEHTGDGAFHDRTAIATGTRQRHLVRRALAVQACGIEIVEHRLRRGARVDRLDRCGDTDRANPSRLQRLTHREVIGPQVARHRMARQLARPLNPCEGGLDLVHQGHHIAGIERIPVREMHRNDKARGRR